MAVQERQDEKRHLIRVPQRDIYIHRSLDEKLSLSYGDAEHLLHKIEDIEQVLGNLMLPTQASTDPERSCSICRKLHLLWARMTGFKVLLLTIIIQLLSLVVMTSVDTRKHAQESSSMMASCTALAILQVMNLLLVILISARLMKEMTLKHVSPVMFLGTYITTLFLFSGLYTITYILEPSSWYSVEQDVDGNPGGIMILYAKFLFYSASTSSLCGSSDAVPKGWHNMILSSIQMITSFIYFACVLCNAWYSLKHQAHEFHPRYGSMMQSTRRRLSKVQAV
ncbi:hypothetical protein ScPMuIL_009506 [Solemya velum]